MTESSPDVYNHVQAIYARLADLCGKLELLAAVAPDLPPARLHHLLCRLAAQDRAWLAQQGRPADAGPRGGASC